MVYSLPGLIQPGVTPLIRTIMANPSMDASSSFRALSVILDSAQPLPGEGGREGGREGGGEGGREGNEYYVNKENVFVCS